MKRSTVSLTPAEWALVQETERSRMLELDEDQLVDLHGRVRRARTKHVGLYRRQASARVSASRGRGAARPQNATNAARAEVFEDALARVSRRLAVSARDSAAELKAERLAAARGAASTGPGLEQAAPRAAVPGEPPVIPSPKSAGRKKREASSAGAGARRQAKRDSR